MNFTIATQNADLLWFPIPQHFFLAQGGKKSAGY